MIYDNILPDLKEVFSLNGLQKNVHYVIDKKPPSKFIKPHKELERYDRSISLSNGFAIQFVSFGRYPDLIRGKSFDGGIIDEGLLLNEDIISKVMLPTLRGYDHWNKNPLWKTISIYTSYPRKPEGRWILKYKKLAQKFPTKYYFLTGTAYDNIAVVGQDYIDMMQNTMNYVDFQIEIMNTPVKDLPNSYYHKFDEDKHSYTCEFEINPESRSDLTARTDYSSIEDIHLSFDFGGKYTCCTVSQGRDNIEYFINEFDTNNLTDFQRKTGEVKKLKHVVADFCAEYKKHGKREVYLWGDRVGLHKNPTDELTYFEQIKKQLENNRWKVHFMVEDSHSALHKSRWFFINELLDETVEDFPKIRINSTRCPNLIQSLAHTRIKEDFKKDKKDERNPNFNQSLAPHLSDTFDYKVFNKYIHLLEVESTYHSKIDSGIDII